MPPMFTVLFIIDHLPLEQCKVLLQNNNNNIVWFNINIVILILNVFLLLGGLMKTSEGDLPPYNVDNWTTDNDARIFPSTSLFFTGIH